MISDTSPGRVSNEVFMPLRRHAQMLAVVSAAWLLFWVAGLPDYYRQYSTAFMIVFDAAVLPPIWFVVYSRVRKAGAGRGLAASLWLSFYITVPLFVYDLAYCGYYLDHGIGFVREYWYLTAYYVLPWLLFPLTGWWVDRQGECRVSGPLT
jgi:Na+/proline symporter